MLKGQYKLLQSKAKVVLLLAGIGYGKSYTLAHYVLNMVVHYPKSKGLIVANTYTQLQNATLPAITGLLTELNIPFTLTMSGAKKALIIGQTTIFIYSLDTYENIRGIEVGWITGDEVCFAKKEAIDVIAGRLRDKNGPLYMRFFSSPNGFNWAYDMFEGKDGINKTDTYELIRGKTKENIHLPNGYYDYLLESYGGESSALSRQELFGEFTNLNAGSIYWAFNREKQVRPVTINPTYPIYVGQDFNIGLMANCYVQYINGVFYVIKETILKDNSANTFDAAASIVNDLGPYHKHVIPDSTGSARKTSSTLSDHQIMRNAGLNVMETTNPLIRDRQNCLNLALSKDKLVIDPSCVTIIKELESLSQREKEGSVSHVAVALGYVVWKLNPLVQPRKANRTIQL